MKKISRVVVCFALLLALFGCQESKKQYTIQYFDINHAVCNWENVDEGDYKLTEVAPEVEGYSFEGWALNGEIVTEIKLSCDVDLYAQYIQNPVVDPIPDHPQINYIIYTEELEQYVEINEHTVLRWNITPEGYSGPVEVKCSDDTVISVNNDGSCVGLKEGIATITVTIDDAAVQFIAEVHDPNKPEEEPDPNPDVFELVSEEFLYLKPGDKSQIEMNVSSDNEQTRTLVYSSDNDKVATVDQNGMIQVKDYGSTVIRCGTKDGKYEKLVFVYSNGAELKASLAYPQRQYRLGDYLEVYLNYVHYNNGAVSTTNGLAEENLKMIVDEGPKTGIIEFNCVKGGCSMKVIEPYAGDMKIHFEIGKVKSETLTIHIIDVN